VILPVGCPTCITDERQRAHLPDSLKDDVTLVDSGALLLTGLPSEALGHREGRARPAADEDVVAGFES
jgi:hypothetical protein